MTTPTSVFDIATLNPSQRVHLGEALLMGPADLREYMIAMIPKTDYADDKFFTALLKLEADDYSSGHIFARVYLMHVRRETGRPELYTPLNSK